ncbi:Mce protein [Mycolicibacterium vaccae]|uniref:Mce protein n=1 Tax=Mycolicibacterium vaccae TaxID=1810 RepID=UPI003CF02882
MADDAAAPDGELTKPTGDAGSQDGQTAAVATQTDVIEEYDEAAESAQPGESAAPARKPMSHVKLALIAGLVVVLALTGLTAWLGYHTYESHRAEQQRNLFLQVGRQGALNLTTINWESAEEDVQRILDSATGTFYDDFQQRAQPFVEVVKQAQSTSEGTIAEAGLESHHGDEGQVLVAVTVRTSNAGAPEQQPRAWRMRITVQEVNGEAKVSKVDFVP